MSLQQNHQDIADAETALQALGIDSTNYSKILQQLVKRRNALQDIARIQQNQFHDDAFNLISKVQSASAQTDKVVIISQFLRQFAEHIAGQTLILQQTYQDAKTIVDNIMPIGNKN